MAAGCEGGSWEGVRRKWSLSKYNKMGEYWSKAGPPVHIAVAAYLGLIKPDKKKTSSQSRAQQSGSSNLNELEKLLARTGGVING